MRDRAPGTRDRLSRPDTRQGWQRWCKRAVDIAASGILVVALSPVIAVSALAVILEDGPPALFHQRRSGKDGREFSVSKFRTMRVHDTTPEEVGQVHLDHALVTRSGHILRRLKIDELPQLLSVLRGDMSLVGPRPTLPSHALAYDAFERRRLEVTPGMTGWAQINGNTSLAWPERIALDVWYVDHWSLGLDFNIMLRTVGVVLRGERPDPAALREAKEHEDRARGHGGEHARRA
jgi:lipopolysaccharide/colanic/teichoic acid biosynthesis glycosyltransferase